jgi:hypothetical protein
MGYDDEDRGMSEAGETDRTMTPLRMALIIGCLLIFWSLMAAISFTLFGWAGK